MKRVKTCSIEGCGQIVGPHAARGWCASHYSRWWRHGDPLGGLFNTHGEDPTPHDQCHFVITRYDNDRWRKDNEAKGYHRDWQHSALYLAAHAAEMGQGEVAA